MRKTKVLLVFFNASVVLAGLRKPSGGSGELLRRAKKGKLKGIISEVILDEVLRHAKKTGLTKIEVEKRTLETFSKPLSAPSKKSVEKHQKVVIDVGDAHVLASAEEAAASFLVSLDKKHILSLKRKKFPFKILTPGELIKA